MLNSEGFATNRRFFTVHKEAMSKARVTDAELAQHNLYSTTHAESNTPWLRGVLENPQLVSQLVFNLKTPTQKSVSPNAASLVLASLSN